MVNKLMLILKRIKFLLPVLTGKVILLSLDNDTLVVDSGVHNRTTTQKVASVFYKNSILNFKN